MKVLFVGDVVGNPGRKLFSSLMGRIKCDFGKIDFIIVNGENAAGGFGITENVINDLFAAGADVITGGNHIFDKKESMHLLSDETRLLRPANYPGAALGRGYGEYEKNGLTLGVLNLQGRTHMLPSIDCPFRTADAVIESSKALALVVDFHAEATSEKRAMALYLDGRVSAVLGTHTHVQTADEGLLPKGTAYITDVGMTGGHGDVIGMEYPAIISRFLTGLPSKFEVSNKDLRLCAACVDIDEETGRALDIKRINIKA